MAEEEKKPVAVLISGEREPRTVPSPRNCKNPCPYGRYREFCWPCIAKLMKREGNESNDVC